MNESESSTKDATIKKSTSKPKAAAAKASAKSKKSVSVTSKDSSSSSTEPSGGDSNEPEAPASSSEVTDTPTKQSQRKPTKMHVRKSEDGGKAHEPSSPTKPAPKPVDTRRRSSSGHSAKGESKGADKNMAQAGASSAPTNPAQDSAGSAGGMDMMAKMMMMMSKGGSPAMPPGQKGGTPDLKSMMAKSGGGGGMMEMMMKGGGGGMMEMMMKGGGMKDMMSMMAKGGGMPDMMSMMAKGGGMPDMMSMMAKGGGMPDMMSMMAKGGGMPDMMAMMGKGGGGKPDMNSMMGKGKESQKGSMGMAKMFDCIIEVALAKAESDVSDDDDESVPIEIPCKYCSRFFSSQMTLKTHILVAHEHEDTSVLNLKKLAIDGKGKRGVKDHHGARRKQSRDCEKSAAVEAAGTDTKLPDPVAVAKVASSEEDLSGDSAASRGLKRGRSKGSEAEETSGAAGVGDSDPPTDHALRSSTSVGSAADPTCCAAGSAQELRKRKIRMRSQRSDSGETSLQVTTKKKSRSGERNPESESSQGEESSSGELRGAGANKEKARDDKSQGRESARHAKGKASAVTKDLNPPEAPSSASQRAKRTLKKDKDLASSDTETGADVPPGDSTPGGRGGGRKGRQSAGGTAASSSSASLSGGDQSPSTTRRSLRSRKSY